MGDRVDGYTVSLTRSCDEETANRVKTAIEELREVATVEPIIETHDGWIRESRTRSAFVRGLLDLCQKINRSEWPPMEDHP